MRFLTAAFLMLSCASASAQGPEITLPVPLSEQVMQNMIGQCAGDNARFIVQVRLLAQQNAKLSADLKALKDKYEPESTPGVDKPN